jgi:hypothetical protein
LGKETADTVVKPYLLRSLSFRTLGIYTAG